MTRFMTKAAIAAVVLLTAAAAFGQEQATRPGWTFVPAFGYSQTYDDNVTLFGQADFDTSNNDLISVYTPQAWFGAGQRLQDAPVADLDR